MLYIFRIEMAPVRRKYREGLYSFQGFWNLLEKESRMYIIDLLLIILHFNIFHSPKLIQVTVCPVRI